MNDEGGAETEEMYVQCRAVGPIAALGLQILTDEVETERREARKFKQESAA